MNIPFFSLSLFPRVQQPPLRWMHIEKKHKVYAAQSWTFKKHLQPTDTQPNANVYVWSVWWNCWNKTKQTWWRVSWKTKKECLRWWKNCKPHWKNAGKPLMCWRKKPMPCVLDWTSTQIMAWTRKAMQTMGARGARAKWVCRRCGKGVKRQFDGRKNWGCPKWNCWGNDWTTPKNGWTRSNHRWWTNCNCWERPKIPKGKRCWRRNSCGRMNEEGLWNRLKWWMKEWRLVNVRWKNKSMCWWEKFKPSKRFENKSKLAKMNGQIDRPR